MLSLHYEPQFFVNHFNAIWCVHTGDEISSLLSHFDQSSIRNLFTNSSKESFERIKEVSI